MTGREDHQEQQQQENPTAFYSSTTSIPTTSPPPSPSTSIARNLLSHLRRPTLSSYTAHMMLVTCLPIICGLLILTVGDAQSDAEVLATTDGETGSSAFGVLSAFEGAKTTTNNKGEAVGGLAVQPGDPEGDLSFWGAFLNSVSMIIVTELGDKTFFIAAVLAMRYDRLVIFSGAIGALIFMTILSAAIGNVLPSLLPRKYTHYASAMLFLYFGCKLLLEARGMDASGPSDELEEVEAELIHKKEGRGPSVDQMENGKGSSGVGTPSSGNHNGHKGGLHPHSGSYKVFTQAFTLTFLAEWGDRSQIATIALAAAKDPYGVTAGGVIGHSLCTGLAVVGGRILAARISERTVAITGGILFLVFCIHSLALGPSIAS